MEDQPNVLGATVFWLYIAFALLFTYSVIESIVKSPKPAPHKHVATFSIMAAISFSTLSFNMLHVLIDSYSIWSERQIVPLSLSPFSVWQWSITSTLFRDFGEAIVLDEARFLWTQSALMATMSVSFFMGIEGMSLTLSANAMCADPLRQVCAIESHAYGLSLLYLRSCPSRSHSTCSTSLCCARRMNAGRLWPYHAV